MVDLYGKCENIYQSHGWSGIGIYKMFMDFCELFTPTQGLTASKVRKPFIFDLTPTQDAIVAKKGLIIGIPY